MKRSVGSDVWSICERGSNEEREIVACVGRSACRRGCDVSRGVELVFVVWEEVSGDVVQLACEGGDCDVGCVGRGFVSSGKVDDDVMCSIELSDVVVELLTGK